MAGKKVIVDLFYDVISPYSWFGFEAVTRHAAAWPAVDVKLRPFFLGQIMAESKNKPPGLVRAKSLYMLKDIKRLAGFHGVPLSIPAAFMEYIFRVEEQKQQMLFLSAVDLVTSGEQTESVSREFFKAIFTEHTEVGKLPFRELAERAGMSQEDAAKSYSSLKDKEVEERLNKNGTDALSYGAFGAPTLVAHLPTGPEIFFGSDRIELLAHSLGQKYHGALLCKNKL